MALSDQLIADIIARVGERQPRTPADLRAIELELCTKWGGKRTYVSKVVRDALAVTSQHSIPSEVGDG